MESQRAIRVVSLWRRELELGCRTLGRDMDQHDGMLTTLRVALAEYQQGDSHIIRITRFKRFPSRMYAQAKDA